MSPPFARLGKKFSLRKRALVGFAVALLAVVLTVALAPFAAHALPVRSYGPPAGRFQASFAASPTTSEGLIVEEGEWLLKMQPSALAYQAALGGNAYEEVDVAVYPHAPSAKELRRYLNWLRTPSITTRGTWHGLVEQGFDVACHEGDSPIPCPGRQATEVIVDGRVVYELSFSQVSETEVRRFYAAFKPV